MSHIHRIIYNFLANCDAFNIGFCIGLYWSIVKLYFTKTITFDYAIFVIIFTTTVTGIVMWVLREFLIYAIVKGLPQFAQGVIASILLAGFTIAIINLFNGINAKSQPKTQTAENNAKN
jgi:hypothetical protein